VVVDGWGCIHRSLVKLRKYRKEKGKKVLRKIKTKQKKKGNERNSCLLCVGGCGEA